MAVRLKAAVLDFNNRAPEDNNDHPSRVFIDLSTSLSLFGQQATGLLRAEHTIARQLLTESRIVAIPFVFSAGKLYALSRADAQTLVGEYPGPGGSTIKLHDARHELRMLGVAPAREAATTEPHDLPHKILPATAPATAALAVQPAPPRPPVRALLRKLARRAVTTMPASIREDVRLVLVHGREIFRKTLRGQAPQESAGDSAETRPAMVAEAPVSEQAYAPAAVAANDFRDEIARTRSAIFGRCVEIGWPEAGEMVWTCGFYGPVVPLRLVAEARQRRGFSCAAIYHDFIRGKTLEWDPDELHGLHYACLATDLLDVADRILCISLDARSSLIAFAHKFGRGTPDVRVVTPGRAPSMGATEAALPHELTRRRFALCVGPIDRYLNLGVLVRAWEALAEQPDFGLDLVIVGHATDCDEAPIIAVETSRLFGERILWFDECPGNVLGLLCRRADALLYPGFADQGFAEGRELSIAEALAAGTPVLAAKTAAVPGAAFGGAILLEPNDDGAWQKALQDLATSRLRQIPPIQLPTWDTTSSEVVSHIVEMAQVRTA